MDAGSEPTGRTAAPAWPWLADPAAEAGEGPDAGEFRHAFRVGTDWLLIPPGMPAEVHPPLPCARLPFTHPWCLGLANFRGDLAPVYDLGALLGGHAPGPGRYFLRLGQRDAAAALCIEAVTGLTLAPAAPCGPTSGLPEPLSGLLQGTRVRDGTDYHELDLSGLLALLAARAGLLQDGSIAP